MKEQRIKVVYKKPGNKAITIEVLNELKEFQYLIEGYIEVIHIPELGKKEILIICNEEGKIKQFDNNIYCDELNDILVGNLIAASCDDEGNFTSLDQKQIIQALNYFDHNDVNETIKRSKSLFDSLFLLT